MRRPKMLIVSDGKPGHFNQSLGVVSQFTESDFSQLEVKFKRKWRDNFLRLIFAIFGGIKFPKYLLNLMLKFALTDSTCQKSLELGHKGYELVISTGSSVAAINLILSSLSMAKSVVCTRPSPIGIKPFDLAILPRHQWPKRHRRNVVQTVGVPNRIDPESVSKLREEARAELGLSDKPRLGVLLGGDDPHYYISMESAKKLADTLLKICSSADMELALTTSRRTPKEVEEFMELTLSKQKSCALFAIAGGTIGVSNPVPVILAISEVIIATEDSFSMVCEAASSGKNVVALEVDRKKNLPHPDREVAYISLSQEIGIRRCKIEELQLLVPKLISDPTPQKALEDAKTAANAIRRLFDQ